MRVKAGTIPGVINDYAVADHATVEDVLRTAGLDSTGSTITVNGVPSSADTVVSDGARVLLTKNAKGN